MTEMFIKHLKHFGINRFLAHIFIFSVGVITARILSPEDRGIYAIFFLLVGLCMNFFSLGMSQANIYFLNSNERKAEVHGNTLLFILISSFTAALILLFSYSLSLYSYFDIKVNLLWIFLLWATSVFGIIEVCLSGLILGYHQYKTHSNFMLIQAFLIFSFTCILFVVSGTLEKAVALRIIAIAFCIIYYCYVSFYIVTQEMIKVSLSFLKKQLMFGAKNWFQNMIGLLNYRGYLLLLAIYSGNKAVGYFSVAMLLLEVVRFIPDTMGTLLLPYLKKFQEPADANLFAAQICRIVLWTSISITFIAWLTLPKLVPIIFGSKYEDVILIASILFIGAAVNSTYQILTRYFTSVAMQKSSILAALSSLTISTALCIFLIPIYGTVGAAISFVSGACVSSYIMVSSFCGYTGLSKRSTLFLNANDFRRFKSYIYGQSRKLL